MSDMCEAVVNLAKLVERRRNDVDIQEQPSAYVPGRTVAVISARSFEACQSAIEDYMEYAGNGSFSIPVLAADGKWCAGGYREWSRS